MKAEEFVRFARPAVGPGAGAGHLPGQLGLHEALAVTGAGACLGPFVSHAAAPCLDTFALHWEAYCGAAGVGGVWQIGGFGEFLVGVTQHWVGTAGLCTLKPLGAQLVLR